MTHYIIIEDERFAYEELKRMMQELRPEYALAGWAQSIEQAVPLLRGAGVELVIADIRLSDGMCFDAFEQCRTDIPVIFTTAYDEYAIKAFRLNSVDYLLKPVEEGDLERALRKFERNQTVRPSSKEYEMMVKTYMGNVCKNRFLIRIGDEYRYVEAADVAFFHSEDKAVFLNTFGGKSYIIDHSLDNLEKMLDQSLFFRVSRGCIANVKAIAKVSRFFGGRLHVQLSPDSRQRIVVSRARVEAFLSWLGGGD